MLQTDGSEGFDKKSGTPKRNSDHASEDLLNLCEMFITELCNDATTNARKRHELSPTEVEENSHVVLALHQTRGGCFGISKEGYYGMFPPQALTGDEIFMIEGGVKTFLIRWRPDCDSHEWLGEVFVYNFEERLEKATATGLRVTISVV